WLGSAMSESGMGVVSAHAPATTIEEAKTNQLFFGATGPETDPAMDARLVNDLFGTKIKTINGYKGQPEEFLALEKGEVNGLFMSGWSGPGRAHVLEEQSKGILKTLVQMSRARDPQVPDTPTILELVQNPGDRQMVELLLNRLTLGRPFVTPPGVPQERLQLLRTAFLKAVQDPDLLADAAMQKLHIQPTSGAEAQELIEQMYQVPAALLERTRKIVRVTSDQ
ncbi:MAG TPA: tripartite tricarboxylate transporter substrate-binding protein, partial [Beijerinckiaceae bacterium]|nr:tripartite tricarboxylate transporter substrate-binding protein [Beijerinckiaceae bacterium]